MKHFILALVMAFSIFGCATSTHTPVKSPDTLHAHIGDSTVALVGLHVEVQQDETGEVVGTSVSIFPYCTGVWVNETELVTAGHCVAHEEGFDPVGDKVYYVIQKEVKDVLDDPSAVHRAKVVAFDEDHDLALIKAVVSGMPEHSSVGLASEMPALGEHVYSVGHPKGMYWTFAEGTVSAYRENTVIGEAVQVNATVWYGNSGGGVFDSSGNLVGICSRLTRVPMMNYFVHLDSVKRMLKDYHEPTPHLGK